jgi:hypothetical protein
MPMRRENGRVVIDISQDEFDELLLALGYAAGDLMREGGNPYAMLRLANSINEGNPAWTPYELPPET